MPVLRALKGKLTARLAWQLLALFLVVALIPLALSDWLSMTAVTQLAQSRDAQARAQYTRGAAMQVLDRLVLGKTLLQAMPVNSLQDGSIPGSHHHHLGMGSVFSALAEIGADGRTAWASDPELNLSGVWMSATQPFTKPSQTAHQDRIVTVLRVSTSPGKPPHILLGRFDDGALRWIAQFDTHYLWAPLAYASEDGESIWTVRDAQGQELVRMAHGAITPAEGGPAPAGTAQRVYRAPLFLRVAFNSADWTFVQHAPAPQVLWHGEHLETWLGSVAVATLLAIALLAHWQIRRTLRPLQRLTSSTRELAAGVTTTRVNVQRHDEIGVLAGAFNDMASRIESQLTALRGLAVIDREILSGASMTLLAGQVLRQLDAFYPDTHATACWLDGATTLRLARLEPRQGADARDVAIDTIVLDQAQERAFAQHITDEQLPLETLEASAGLALPPWLRASALAGARWLVLLPLVQQGRAQALITLAMPQGPITAQRLQSAVNLRDRLSVAQIARTREQQLMYRATHDSLTGLANRDGLHAQLEALLTLGATSAPLAVVFLDLDHFKDVNDSRGHEAGDEILRMAGARLRACVPSDALVARQGGDEFVIVLPGASAAAAGQVADRVIAAMRQPFPLQTGTAMLDASAGMAFSPEHAHTREELLRCADLALYAAKEAGRGRHMTYNAELDALTQARVALLADLQHAVQSRAFVMYYQPRVVAAGGSIVSAEALIRWQHPTQGLLEPGTFIDLAEESNLIVPIGNWVLDETCKQLAAWLRQGLALHHVSVNVSPRQLEAGDLPKQVRAALQRHGVAPQHLELEITESLLVGDTETAFRQLAALRAEGVTIALDDFGTGYASLATLHKLPIDVMKVDRSFVTELGVDDTILPVVRAIVTLAQAGRLRLVAEGVETAEQATMLRKLGCDELQGYLYGKPMPAEDFARIAAHAMRTHHA